MELFYSATSPFVRKCLVVAHELGLRDRLKCVPAAAHPINRSAAIVAHNPLGQVPTLICTDGTVLYDSRVICEFLDALAGGRLIPAEGPARWTVLVQQSLADGVLDAAVLARYESALRPESLRWKEWMAGQIDKVQCGLAEIERAAAGFAGRIDLGTISIACALAYLDFRFDHLGWRGQCPAAARWFQNFDARESMASTRPDAG